MAQVETLCCAMESGPQTDGAENRWIQVPGVFRAVRAVAHASKMTGSNIRHDQNIRARESSKH